MLSNKAYLESLPKKRMGAGCLFFDEHGRVLLVKPTYKPGWEIPGGVVELNESPKACCRREIHEEIGLERKPGGLLVVDYNTQAGENTESLMFIFDGGVLASAEIQQIHLHPTELSELGFFTAEALPVEMNAALRKRVLAAWQQAHKSTGIYLEDQEQN